MGSDTFRRSRRNESDPTASLSHPFVRVIDMPRKTRTDYPGAIHHVMNRGVDHGAVFFDDADRVDFGRQLGAMHERFGVEFLAYCLMGNHYHLLVRTPGADLAQSMQLLGTTYTRHVNDRLGRDGPLFRGRYHSIVVESDVYLLWVTRYIHRNPLVYDGVDAPDRYRWSSYRSYTGDRRPPPFLDTHTVTSLAGGAHELMRLTEGRDGISKSWSAADIMQLVSFVTVEQDLAAAASPQLPRLERTIALLVAERLGSGVTSAGIMKRLGYRSEDARFAALRRARFRASDPVVAALVDRVLRVVHPHTAAA